MRNRTQAEIRTLYNLAGVVLLAAADALAEDRPARRLIVSIPDRRLSVVEDGHVVKVYAVAVGAPGTPSPEGEFTVVARIPEPTWYWHGRVVPPGKRNPLGTRWLGLSANGYGIHGTNQPSSIGKGASHGCIRMRNQDIEVLFRTVAVGDVVELRGERTSAAAATSE